MRALALMSVRNEADILPWTLTHLVRQGCSVYIVDNWSTDGSWEMLQHLPVIHAERFPVEGDDGDFSCRRIHRRLDEIAANSGFDWCIFHDADEIRRSPRPGETIAMGLQRVEEEGFNAVNHRLYLFPPTSPYYHGDPERSFRYYSDAHVDCANGHVKAWKNQNKLVNLGVWSTGGGHYLDFPGIRVHPEPWVLKHYPIRSQAHGERKMRERHSRWNREEKNRGWHIQYDRFNPMSSFVASTRGLKQWGVKATPTYAYTGKVTLMTLSKFPDIFSHLHQSVLQFAPNVDKLVVKDASTEALPAVGWTVLDALPGTFVFANNWNMGAQHVLRTGNDLLFVNDDVELVQPDTVERLQRIAYADPSIGILSPLIRGTVGNPLQSVAKRVRQLTYSDYGLAFVCVFIKAEVLRKVGLVDTRFVEYGSDDIDYCIRAQKAGYRLAVTPEVIVNHGHGSASFLRGMTDESRVAQMRRMQQVLREKWANES